MSERRFSDEKRDSDRSRGRSGGNSKLDLPKNSRLFVIASKAHTEEILRDHFSQFEGLEDVWLVTDKRTGEKKGVAYIKYSKASLAAKALEGTDGKVIGSVGRAVKVKVAQSRESGSTRDFDEDEELTRIFLVTPKSYGEAEIREKFEVYGDINRIHLLTDKKTGEKKGLAYVKYYKMSDAASAIESCDPDFRAVWAEPRGNKTNNRDDHRRGDRDRGRDDSWDRGRDRGDRGYDRGSDRDMRSKDRGYDDYLIRYPSTDYTPLPSVPAVSRGGGYDEVIQQFASVSLPVNATARLQVDVSGKTSEQQLSSLFNIVPGMEYCDFRVEQNSWGFRGTAHVRYKNKAFAAYARMRLNGLECPEGCPLMIQFMGSPETATRKKSDNLKPNEIPPLMPPSASSGNHAYVQSSFMGRESFTCSVQLPPPQLLAPEGSEVKERLFVILTRPLPEQVIQDVFCRYGQLINYYNIKGRNYGYAKYADEECARKAMEALHGQEVCGERLKVVIAEPEESLQNKRARTD